MRPNCNEYVELTFQVQAGGSLAAFVESAITGADNIAKTTMLYHGMVFTNIAIAFPLCTTTFAHCFEHRHRCLMLAYPRDPTLTKCMRKKKTTKNMNAKNLFPAVAHKFNN